MLIKCPHYAILILFLGAFQGLEAQWRGPRLTHIGPEQGLASWTFGMAQDSMGYIYFGTDNGIVRYDGSSFELFAHNPEDSTSIGPGDVWCILSGSDDQIWMGSRLSGLNVFDPKTKKFKKYPTPNAPLFDYDAITSIMEDHEHQLWMGGDAFRLFHFDRAQNKFETFVPDWYEEPPQVNRYSIREIFQDLFHPDLLWISVLDYIKPGSSLKEPHGLISFNKRTKIFQQHNCAGQPKYQDTDGKLWLVGMGIYQYDPGTKSCVHFPITIVENKKSTAAPIRDFIPMDQGFLGGGPHSILDFQKDGLYQFVLNDNDLGVVEDVFEDSQKHIWFGRSNGATVLNQKDQEIQYYSLEKFGLRSRIYPGRLAYDPLKDAIYLGNHGFDGDGRSIIEIPMDQRKQTKEYKKDFFISGLATDVEGKLWIYGKDGFHSSPEFPKKDHVAFIDGNCTQENPSLWNISTSAKGWIGGIGYDQFIWFMPGKKDCQVINRSDLPVESGIHTDSRFQGMTFISDEKALIFSNIIYEVDLNSGSASRLKLEEGVHPYTQSEINSVIEDTRGHIWFCTLNLTGEFKKENDSLLLVKRYTTKDGLISAWAHELYPDRSGRVWFFASNGLSAIDPVSHDIRHFGVKEGLVDPYIDPRQVITLTDGRIATVNGTGLIVFHPDSLWNTFTPEHVNVVLKEIRIAGKSIYYDGDVNFLDQLSLKPNQNYIDIQFQGLAFPNDYKLQYCYKVEGLHEEWISIGTNKIITLSSLPPGDYVLRIKAGAPTSPAPEKTIKIHVDTPLVFQPWFILLGIGLILSGAYFIYRWRIRLIRDQEVQKAETSKKMAELELKALRAQMNPHFMFNSLNSIKNYILRAEPKIAAEYLSSFAHLIRLILQNSREKTITLKEELETLILYIELEQIRFENKFEFHCIVEDGLSLEQIMIPPMMLQPFVENAIWHGLMHMKEPGNLYLRFSREGKMIASTIEDDGVGRKKALEMKSLSATRYKSMGMGITKDRMDIMNKMDDLGITAEIIDKYSDEGVPEGTKVIIRIPDDQDHI